MKTKKSDNDSKLPKSYCLWGPGSNVYMASDKNNCGCGASQKVSSVRKKESVGTQDIVKESDISEQRVKNSGNTRTKAKSTDKKDRDADSSAIVSADVKRKRNKISGTGDNKTKSTRRSKSGSNKECESDLRETDGGIEGRKSKKEITVFPKSNTLLGSIALTHKPVPTEDFSIVQVDIEGKTYEVSPWSIIDGHYIQGLDSNFLVRGFVNSKSR